MAVSFTMEIEDSTRQEVVIGLVLMTFLFKLSALSPSMLPPISYTTMLDRFLLLNSTMVWFIIVALCVGAASRHRMLPYRVLPRGIGLGDGHYMIL